jgi:hypothetical protein
MTTLYGPWEGTGSGKARIRLEYTRTYKNNNTEANFDGTVYIEFDTSISDSTNSWNVASPNFTDANGSNLNISFGSGGGKKAIKSFDFDANEDGEISASVSNIEYIGETVNASFTLPVGDLAPTWNDTNYSATGITATSFTTTGINADGNGGSRNNVQVQYNTSASSTGASTKTVGSYANTTVTGLTRATTYYFRVRVSNTTYGYGEWGPWKSFTTLSTVPGAPIDTWNFSNITQTTADVNGPDGVADNGGSALNNWQTCYNTSASESGATWVTSGNTSVPDLTGLTPGTTYYAKIRAANANGWGPYSAWKSFTTLPGVMVKVGGVWKVATPYVKVNGVWKEATRYIKIGGVWKG